MDYRLVVDGGGTSTRAVVADAAGHIVARGLAGPGNLAVQPREAWLAAVLAAVREACAQLPGTSAGTPRFTRVWVGAAGINDAADERAAAGLLEQALSYEHLSVTNDAALLCAPDVGAACVVAVAGTGSVVQAYGPGVACKRALAARIGGLGWLLGDEGSAYGIGREALRAALDGETSMHAAICAVWGVRESETLLARVYAPGDAKARIAALSPVVIHGAARGEPAALRIVDKETERLATQIVRAYAALNHRAILSLGGALVHEPVYQAALLRHVGSLPWLRVDAISDAAACAARAT